MGRRRPVRFVILLCAGLAGLLPMAPAEETRWVTTVAGERDGAVTNGRLQAARDLEAKKDWEAVVEEYASILANAGDDLVPLSDRHFVQARLICQRRLALLPPEALTLYRKRADGPAKKWFESGAAERDPRLLRRVVNEAFYSRPAEAALDLLGELAFEQGHPEEAARWWSMLAVPASQAGKEDQPAADRDLIFPDPQGDKARYRAKQLLARLFHGDPGFSAELKAFRTLHPKAEGLLAGRKGNYGEILQALSEQPGLKEPPRSADAWPAFGGDNSRNRILPSPPDRNWLSRLCEDDPIRFDLIHHKLIKAEDTPPPAPPGAGKSPSLTEAARSLASYPVVLDHKVAVPDADGVTLYDPLTGAVHDWSLKDGAQGEGKRDTKLPAPPDLRWTLTASGRRLYVRLGAESFGPAKKLGQEPSLLVCLELLPDEQKLSECWRVRASKLDKDQTAFEGSPVVADGRVYVALTRLDDRASTFIACLDAGTGVTRWRQDVCETTAVDPKQPRFRHHLLTLAGPSVVYASHNGVIASFDADTGKRIWAARYPTRGLMIDAATPSPRDLTPCIYDGARLFVAPADYDRLLCLDAATGRTLWERDKIEAVHLLGVAEGKLVFDTIKSIRAVAVVDGVDQWSAPSVAEGSLTYGRGLILGDVVLYPTRHGVTVLCIPDGQATERLNLPNGRLERLWGNLAYADGILAVTDRTSLTVHVAPALWRNQRKKDARENPNSPTARYRLAIAETDAGDLETAIAEWKRLEQMTADDSSEGRSLRRKAQEQRHELLLRSAKRALSERPWEKPDDYLHEASRPEFPDELRLRARAFQAILWQRADLPAHAAVAYDSIARDEMLRTRTVLDENGNPQVAGIWAVSRIDDLIRAHGLRVYAAVGEVGPTPQGTRLLGPLELEDALCWHPHAYASCQLTGSYAASCEPNKQGGLASAAWRSSVRHGPYYASRVHTQVRLAHLYEWERCRPAAIRTWQQIERDDATPGPAGAVWRTLAAAQIQRIQARALQAATPTEIELPWQRTGETELSSSESLLPRDETTGAPSSDDLFLLDGRNLICRAENTGKPLWRRTLRWMPNWLGFQDDWVLAAGVHGIQALTADTGDLLWEYPAPAWSSNSVSPSDIPAPLSAFRISDGKLYFLQGERRFFALDAETGLVLWTRWAPDARLGLPHPRGRFFPKYQVKGERVVLQTSSGTWWLLDAADGRLIFSGPTVTDPWLQAPVVMDPKRWCLAGNPHSVILFDPDTGKELWRHEIPGDSISSHVVPLVVTNGEDIALLMYRNFGSCLQRLDTGTGKPLWKEERFVSNEPANLDEITADGAAFYVVANNVLSAYALSDGHRLWERPLPAPEGNWRVTHDSGQLIVYPLDAAALEFRLRGPLGSLECFIASSVVDFSGQGFPVILADPNTGRLDQRLNFTVPASRIRVTARFNPFPAREPELLLRTTHPLPSASVQFTGAALTVALPERLWRLTADTGTQKTKEPSVSPLPRTRGRGVGGEGDKRP
jgi:cellulose synthase operon protein C